MEYDHTVSQTIRRVKTIYGITLSDTDIFVNTDGKVYVKTRVVAELFRQGYHNFTNKQLGLI